MTNQFVTTSILRNGTATGIIETTIDEWALSGICYKIPRTKLKEAHELKCIDQIGIYILFGKDEETGRDKAYIGKSTNVYDRIREQNREKDFWSECLIFVSETNKLNETHIGHLESMICKEAEVANRYITENERNPKKSKASDADIIVSTKFFEKIKLDLSLQGYKLLEKDVEEEKVTDKDILILKYKGEECARGTMTDEGFMIFEGSKIAKEISKSISPSLVKYVQNERNSDDIVDGKFIKNHLCSTPSMAAVLILGRNSNGYIEWKNKEGKTLKDMMLS